ncbi:putative glutamine amidotransferasec [Weissella cibaria]|nr:putative glutamine amidotransferasec [Weissella cibaria]
MAIIGIPSNHLNHPNPKHRTNYVDYTQQNYTAALREAGALPVVFPMGSPEEAAEYVNSVDAVLLIGGQDVGPLFYGEDPTPQMGETDRQRDLFELAIVAEARKQNKPLMGICRGAQFINVALGGTLIQDIDTQYTPENGNPIVKHDQFPVKWYEPTHRLDVLPDNF